MWNEYAKQYFGDFSQDASSYYYDMTSCLIRVMGLDFRRLQCHHLIRMHNSGSIPYLYFRYTADNFVQYDLINPKISSFDLDQLDYSDRSVPIINMTVVCEAVKYVNDGYPTNISKFYIGWRIRHIQS